MIASYCSSLLFIIFNLAIPLPKLFWSLSVATHCCLDLRELCRSYWPWWPRALRSFMTLKLTTAMVAQARSLAYGWICKTWIATNGDGLVGMKFARQSRAHDLRPAWQRRGRRWRSWSWRSTSDKLCARAKFWARVAIALQALKPNPTSELTIAMATSYNECSWRTRWQWVVMNEGQRSFGLAITRLKTMNNNFEDNKWFLAMLNNLILDFFIIFSDVVPRKYHTSDTSNF